MRSGFQSCWRGSQSLSFLALLMLALLFANCVGLLVDARTVTGAPAWLKPAKFAISTALYAGTLAYVLQFLTVHRRWVRTLSGLITFCLFLEIVIIDLQAARGVESHFNVSTPLNSALYATMGISILTFWLASGVLCLFSFQQSFQDKSWGWALRLGMLITFLGSATGGLMTQPRPGQLGHNAPPLVGSHTVGAKDGGPGLPGVNWSTRHGDIRVAHFFGLHGIQVVPALYLLLRRRRRIVPPRRIFVLAASYAALVAILCWQALHGQSLVEPDGLTLWVGLLWAASSLAAWEFTRPQLRVSSAVVPA